ncbi:SRPBCC family protein [Steroidobacter agaridevorans]|nr:hypothetical protein [Steroidobacter agaridevorans]
MRTYEYRFRFALTLAGLLLGGQSPACELPAGFVDPPRPDIAPLEELVAHTEQIDIARSLAAVMQAGRRPLSEGIRPTRDLPGVSGTRNLTSGGFGTVGARRLVCLTDGSIALEEVLHSEVHSERRRFRYVVWNYTSPKFRDVQYAVGEFIHTQPAPDQTRVNWTYRFALKEGRDPTLFRKDFLDSAFAEWMRSLLERGRSNAEAAPAADVE